MKCYIATYYKYDNYGTRLQNYALSQVLKDLGQEPITIYLNDETKNFKGKIVNIIKFVFSHMPSVTYVQKVWINEYKKKKSFSKFNSLLNIEKFSSEELQNLDFENAIAIAGSDQIWSPNHLKSNPIDEKLFFLQFAPVGKRYAYAPSFGVSSISEEYHKMYIENLDGFTKISIREKAGQMLIKNILKKDVPIVPDPVFLLSKEEWRKKLAYSKKYEKKQYILTYFLGNPDNDRMNKIKVYADENNYELVNIAGNYVGKGYIIPSPDEFVKLIDEASLIFTDSFHAAAFSIIFRKQFFVFKRNDVKQFSRIETLLNKYECNDCYVDDESFSNIESCLTKGEIGGSDELVNEQRIGLEYIKNILESVEEEKYGKL